MKLRPLIGVTSILLMVFIQCVNAYEIRKVDVEIVFEGHRFVPPNVAVPAGVAFTVRVANHDKAAIEFESFKLNREKVVEPGKSIVVRLPALKPGTYDFFDDFHDDVTPGVIVAK